MKRNKHSTYIKIKVLHVPLLQLVHWLQMESDAELQISIGNRMRPSKINRVNIMRVFRSCRNSPSRAMTRAISATSVKKVIFILNFTRNHAITCL